MKRILLVLLCLAVVANAQSPVGLKILSANAHSFSSPNEYNAWAGAQLNYPIVGKSENFDLRFGLTGKFVISFTKVDLGREWNILTFGNIGLPNYNRVSAFNSTVSVDEGLHFGLQGYTIFGKLFKKSLVTSVLVSTKINTYGTSQVVSYRFGTGWEISLADGGLPLVINLTPSYILLDNKAKFAVIQSEAVGRGIWTTDAYLILPLGDKLGALLQMTAAEKAQPVYRLGLIMSTGM